MPGFYNPFWLLGLITLPIVYYLYSRALKMKKLEAMKFSQIAFLQTALGDKKKSRRPQALLILTLTILALLFFGLAGPHIPLKQTKEGVNVVLVIDVSGSMQAADYQPTRLEAAKNSARILLSQLDPKDNAGIVEFASGATTSAYLSPDKERVLDKLQSISENNGQTALGDGLALAVDMAKSLPSKKKVIILLSDGVNNAGVISPDEAVGFAQSSGIQVFTVGMGSNEQVVLGYDWMGTPQYATLDEATLKSIAEKTGGRYFKSVDSATLSQIYSGLNEQITRERQETSIKDLFFVGAVVLLFIELYLRYGKGRIIP